LLRAFTEEFTAGQSAAKDVLREHPKDPNALFFLGKLDLNYVWLVLGTLGRRTGWNEYWEARHSLDAALELEPEYLRARTARAWIDYIVDTRMPWGTGWLLGGGNRKKALSVMREASQDTDDFYDTAENYPVPPDPSYAGRTEEILGRWMKTKPRDALIIATKVSGPSHGWIKAAVRSGMTRSIVTTSCVRWKRA